MSLHHYESDCSRDGWTGTCECGWRGELRTGSTLVAAAAADRDYREHVEAALGAAAYYDADVACRNCGSHHRQGIIVGTHVTSGHCAQCGNRMLEPDNDRWEESRSFTRRFFG